MVATATECRIMIRDDRTTSSCLPMALNGIVSQNDFDDFLTTVNESIQAFDALVVRRKRIGLFQQRIFWVSLWIMCHVIMIGPARLLELRSVRSYVNIFSAPVPPMDERRAFLFNDRSEHN